MTSDPRLRVGIIGTGWMADMIVPDFRRVDAFDLVAVAGRDAARTLAFAEERGIPGAETVDGLLGRDDLDLVYIATTHDSHAELARRAIEHGMPVLLEKAFTMDAAEAEELISLAQDRGVFLMEAMWMRFNPAVRRVAELLADRGDRRAEALHGVVRVPGGRSRPPALGSRARRRFGARPGRLPAHPRRPAVRRVRDPRGNGSRLGPDRCTRRDRQRARDAPRLRRRPSGDARDVAANTARLRRVDQRLDRAHPETCRRSGRPRPS